MAAPTTISQPPQANNHNPTRPVTALANPSNSSQATISTTSTVTSSLTALSSQPQNLPNSSTPNSQNKYRPLNVRDALSYLDQVKVQFQDFPGVYNKFLDIMKDFKTQMIDTPGVIDGVSSLFRGHPSLIQGFNTFLPPGYRIDVSQGDGPNQTGHLSAYSLITVTHPMGIQTQKRVPLQTGGEEIGSHVVPESAVPVSVASTSEQPTRDNVNMSNSSNPSNHFAPQKCLNEAPLPPVVALKPKSITLDAIANLNRNPSPVPSSNPSTDQSKPAVKPLEFNHAITYVNKIKNRYASDPKTYQTFLDILQTYQRDARPIQEVYEQVNQLFSGAPDLLAEFMKFLPDPSGNVGQPPATDSAGIAFANCGASHADGSHPVPSTSAQNITKNNHRDTINNMSLASRYAMPSRAGPPATTHEDQTYTNSEYSGKKRRHPASSATHGHFGPLNDHSTSSGPRTHASLQGSSANQTGETNGDLNRAGNLNQISPSRGVKRKQRAANKASEPASSATSVSGLPPPGFAPHGSATIGEAYSAADTTNHMLDRAKRKSRSSPQNVNVSDQDPKYGLDISRCVPRQSTAKEELLFFYHIKTYFENQTTYIEFLKLINLFTQDLIDLDTLVLRIEPFLINCPELFSRFKDIVGWKDDLTMRKTQNLENGHLSKKKNTDALCWAVLNDKLVCGAPATNDDDQIFLPRQTNAFERALYQAEDERHEYDYHIEANVRTIALLEPINLRIQQMDPETRAEYRLKPGLGGQSKSVYQRIIKKIYGKQQGQEVIQALHDSPALAVPIVLARLKQKDEEWKKALRDWNRGISFKAVDKKMIGSRNLVNEIELIKREQQQKQKLLLNPSLIRFLPKHQLELELKKVDVFYDVLKILIHFLDHVPNSTGLDDAEKDRIEAQLKLIVTLFFNIPEDEFDKHLTPLPPERKGAENESSNPTRNLDTDGDTSDVAASAHNNQGDDERPEGTVGRPSRGASARKRGPPVKDGATNATATTDLRKRAMKNASSGGPNNETSRLPINDPGKHSESSPVNPAGIIKTSSMRDQRHPTVDDANGSVNMSSNAEDSSSAACQDNNSLGEQSQSSAGRATRTNEVHDAEDSKKKTRLQELRLSFFGNNGYYCFFRLIHILYTRFETLKLASLDSDQAAQHLYPTNTDPMASNPSDPITRSISSRRNFDSYKQMLASIENFNSGVIEQSAFEEECRNLFGIKGYLLVTVDKLSNLSHHHGSKKIFELFKVQKKMYESDQANVTDCQKLSYRRSVESLTGNGHESKVYRIEWISSTRAIRIQLIGGDDISQEDFDAMEKAWSDYIESFQNMAVDRTLGLENDELPTTQENVKNFKEESFITETGLAIRICMRSYKMFFHPNTTELLMRKKKNTPKESKPIDK
ncbi:hypothetical protein H4Q26_002041 [Puccinia striiformis f. sp. tritici PST-130]|nr:hypothetical protein H4Q26_002041 [Puccinia striiformis f. sp. tritici PST-130]